LSNVEHSKFSEALFKSKLPVDILVILINSLCNKEKAHLKNILKLFKSSLLNFSMKRSSRRWKKKGQMRWKWQRKKLKKEKRKRKARRARAK